MNYNLNHLVEIISSTPTNYDHSVGFHDIRPFNNQNKNLILLHRYSLNNLGFSFIIRSPKKFSIDYPQTFLLIIEECTIFHYL